MAKIALTNGWLLSRNVDIAAFFAPAIVSVAFFFLAEKIGMVELTFLTFVILQGFGLAPFHLGLTWFHLLDPALRSHIFQSRQDKLRLIAAAMLLLFGTSACMVFMPALVYFVYIIWTVQHLVQQNVGILLLYHNYGENEVVADRTLEVRSLHAAAWLFSLCFLSNYVQQGAFMLISKAAILMAAVDFFFVLFHYTRDVVRQVRDGRALNVPAQIFWLISIACLSPLAFASKDFDKALLIPLFIHWFQYIGLNVVLTGRKYKTRSGFMHKTAILCACGLTVMTVYAGLGFVVYSIDKLPEWLHKAGLGLIFGIGMLHYLQDALLWRFKDPIIRENMLPYIKSRKTNAVAARTAV